MVHHVKQRNLMVINAKDFTSHRINSVTLENFVIHISTSFKSIYPLLCLSMTRFFRNFLSIFCCCKLIFLHKLLYVLYYLNKRCCAYIALKFSMTRYYDTFFGVLKPSVNCLNKKL